MLARERMEDARVGGGGSRDEGHGPRGWIESESAAALAGGGRETRLTGGWLLVKGSSEPESERETSESREWEWS